MADIIDFMNCEVNMEDYPQEFYEERAAIYEYLANYSRKEAEELAYKDYSAKLEEDKAKKQEI